MRTSLVSVTKHILDDGAAPAGNEMAYAMLEIKIHNTERLTASYVKTLQRIYSYITIRIRV